MEKLVGVIGTFILKVRSKMSDILYGAYLLQGDKKANGIQKALDRGVVNLVEEASRIDFCNIFNYLANNKIGQSFNPSDAAPESTDAPLKKVKYYVQSNAFKLQSRIDAFYATYGTLGGSDSTTGLLELIRSINLSISALVNETGLNDPELRKEFPEVDLISNFLNDKLGELSSISFNGTIPTSQIQSIFSTIDKIRSYCVAIQALNNPAAVLSNFANTAVQKEIEKLNKIVKPDKLIPLIYRLLKTCNKINDVCRTILTYISRAKLVIKLAILLIKVFNIVKAFFLTLPVPNQFTTVGVTTKFSEIYQEKLKQQGEKKLLKVLKQIVNVLDDVYSVVSGLVIAITDIIRGLNIILLNIKSCNRGNDDLINEISNTIKELEKTKSDLQSFIDQVNEGKKRVDNTFGGYTIEIVNEQLTDEGIRLKRRYGIARGLNGVIAVESTPTFASLDLIIINEVKVLLISRGYVKAEVSDDSAENALLIMDAMKYLDDNDISLDNTDTNASQQDSTDDVGLQKFVDNLPGGKALRKKVRKKLADNSAKLGSDLKTTDPNSKYTTSIAPPTV
jgi:hypothetical protein